MGRAEGHSPSALLITIPFAKGDTGGLAFGGQSGGGHVHPYLRCSSVNQAIGILEQEGDIYGL